MNIEDTFIQDSNNLTFPGEVDYVAKYKEIKTIFNTEIHPEIKTKMLEYESDGYYNDHGIEHIKMVIERATIVIDEFKKVNNEFNLSDYELFILLVSIQLHDAGHLIDKRQKHTSKTHEMLTRFCVDKLDRPEIMIIANIARAHGGKDDPIGILSEEGILGINVRTRLLASILRLSDELADDFTRASRGLLKLEDQKIDPPHKHISELSEIYHRYSDSLHSVNFAGNEIKLSFCINEEQLEQPFKKKNSNGKIIKQYLLDEIFERTEKMFLESLYCNRFFPLNCRINIIKVKINLLEKYSVSFKTYSYEIAESGYPSVSNGSLVQLTDDSGKKIDGAYIAKLIKKKKDEESI